MSTPFDMPDKYTPDERSGILRVLEKYEIDGGSELLAISEKIVFGMSVAVYTDETFSAKALHQYLQKLANQSRKLSDTLKRIDYASFEDIAFSLGDFLEEKELLGEETDIVKIMQTLLVNASLLSDVSQRALINHEQDNQHEENRGRSQKHGALVALISMLADEWRERGYDTGFNVNKESDELSGPFCSFIDKSLRPILPKNFSNTSLHHRIREALSDSYDRSGSYCVEVPGKKLLISAWRSFADE